MIRRERRGAGARRGAGVKALILLVVLGASLLVAAAPALAAPIVPGGAPVTVNLPVAGDIATLTFDANAGDRVSLEITDVTIGTSVCCSTKVTIVRPDNKTLSSLTLGTNGGFIDAVSLPLSGTYSIVVDPQSTNVGDATLTLHAVPPDTTAAITLGGAPVTVGSTAPGQNATASFAGTVGEIVSLEISDVTVGTSTCCSTKVSLIRPDGRVLATTTVGTNGGFLDAVALPLAGAYSIVVDPQGTLTGGATLLLHDVPADATAAGALGSTTSIATTVPGQNARLTFAGIAGGRVSVEITDVTVGTSFCCSTKVTLLRPDGRVVSTATFGTNGGFLDAAALALTGTYAVVVDPQGSATGAVTITLHDVPADASGTVAFGSSTPVTTTVPGQNANVTFSGVAGQRASVVVSDVSFGTSTCCSLRISILKPNGTVLVTPVSAGSNGGFLDAVVLPTTGTYTLFVDPQGPVTGSATLTLYNVPADAAATIVPGGAPATVSTTVPGQNAGVTFDAVSNQKVSVKVGPSCCATRVSIIKPNGAVLVAAMTMGAGGGFMDTVTIPTTGTYTILVDLQGPATGDVTLTLYDVPADVTGTIAFGVPKTVTTTVPGQNASLTFTGTAGQVVSLVMAGGCCTTRISLLKPNGTVLVSPVSFGAAGGFLDATTLPNNGTYTIAIDPQGAATGALTFTLHTVPAEVTGTLSFGLPAAFATTVPGQNIRLTFAGTSGSRVSLRLDPSCCTTRISLLRPDGSVAAAVTSFGTSPAFLDPVSLTTTGTYTVLLDPQGSSVGAMTTTVYNVPADVTGPISFGTPVGVNLAVPGQNARLTFDGIAGQVVSVGLSNVTIGSSVISGTTISVLRPDGSALASRNVGTVGGFLDAVALPVTGTYTVLVDPLGANTGGITVALEQVPVDVEASIAFGVPLTVTTTVSGQNARVSFAGTAGQRVSLQVSGNCCLSQISIREPDDSVLVAPATFGLGAGFIDTRTLLADRHAHHPDRPAGGGDGQHHANAPRRPGRRLSSDRAGRPTRHRHDLHARSELQAELHGNGRPARQPSRRARLLRRLVLDSGSGRGAGRRADDLRKRGRLRRHRHAVFERHVHGRCRPAGSRHRELDADALRRTGRRCRVRGGRRTRSHRLDDDAGSERRRELRRHGRRRSLGSDRPVQLLQHARVRPQPGRDAPGRPRLFQPRRRPARDTPADLGYLHPLRRPAGTRRRRPPRPAGARQHGSGATRSSASRSRRSTATWSERRSSTGRAEPVERSRSARPRTTAGRVSTAWPSRV